MILKNPTHSDFHRMIESTQRLSDKVFESYNNIKYLLSCCKSQGVPIIGNPLYQLENQFLQLHYLILQHIVNFDVYKDIFPSNLKDGLFLEQIKGLILMSRDFEYSYQDLTHKLISIEDSFHPNISLLA